MISQTAKNIRRIFREANLKERCGGAWVRVWRDGEISAGATVDNRQNMRVVREALEAAGYQCTCDGKPGTVGENIITITAKGE